MFRSKSNLDPHEGCAPESQPCATYGVMDDIAERFGVYKVKATPALTMGEAMVCMAPPGGHKASNGCCSYNWVSKIDVSFRVPQHEVVLGDRTYRHLECKRKFEGNESVKGENLSMKIS